MKKISYPQNILKICIYCYFTTLYRTRRYIVTVELQDKSQGVAQNFM